MNHNFNNAENNNYEILIELIRNLHNRNVIENHNKSIQNINFELSKKKKVFTKLNRLIQFYLIQLAVSELIKSSRIIYNNNKRSHPSIDDIVDELKSMKVSISKSTLNRWINKNFSDNSNMCNQIRNGNFTQYFRNSSASPRLGS
ncbi:MAG: hypothetical protein N3D80_12855 [Ignavibacterium album]|uniref:hypothetical protein n=1 Tax=Ignavibacterium album TaxID=591197 RepID=UPI0026F06E72|nr:hypothetical protein [Ignavibacterium album]MCX8106750.1 hypothetical protein [Ignavibacterium album]